MHTSDIEWKRVERPEVISYRNNKFDYKLYNIKYLHRVPYENRSVKLIYYSDEISPEIQI
jgi:hypothetical protein